MVFLNYSTMQMVAKIVYYGPGLGGKTTNLKTIYQNTAAKARGEMVSLATETDRTLFFDLLPMEVGVISGFKTKFQLYTVPGQVFYNTTRKLVLRGVDGIVFVADSQTPMMDANLDSLLNLKENLEELNLNVESIPFVFQYNKRDLPNVIPVDKLNEKLNQSNKPFVEASAINGQGVFETLREISKQTLMVLNNKALGEKLNESPEPAAENNPEPNKQEMEGIPQNVSFDSQKMATSPEPSDGPLGEDTNPDSDRDEESKDGFEKTLENLELDFAEDDGFDEDSLDMDEFDDWDDSDSLTDIIDEPETEPAGEDTSQKQDSEAEEEPLELDPEEQLETEAPQEGNSESPTQPLAEDDIIEDSDEKNPLVREQRIATEESKAKAVDYLTDMAFHEVEEEAESEPPPRPAEPSTKTEEKPKVKSDEVKPPKPSHPKPRKKETIDASLQELQTFTTQLGVKSAQRRKKASVDSLITGLVSKKGKSAPVEKVSIQVPKAIEKAQLNCVLLDGDDNVIHTQLVKLTPHKTGEKTYRVKLSLDIKEE